MPGIALVAQLKGRLKFFPFLQVGLFAGRYRAADRDPARLRRNPSPLPIVDDTLSVALEARSLICLLISLPGFGANRTPSTTPDKSAQQEGDDGRNFCPVPGSC